MKINADINGAGETWVQVTLTGPGAAQLTEQEIGKALTDLTHPYIIGDLTMKAVFEPNGMRNLYDLQAVLNAVEKALTPGKAVPSAPMPGSTAPARHPVRHRPDIEAVAGVPGEGEV